MTQTDECNDFPIDGAMLAKGLRMIRGFLSGVVWGSVLAALGLGAASQLSPLPVTRIATDATAVQIEKPAAVDPIKQPAAPELPQSPASTEQPAVAKLPAASLAVEPAVEPIPEPVTPAASTAKQLDPPAGSEFAKPLPDVEPILPAAEAAPPADAGVLAPLAPPASDTASVTDAPSAAPDTALTPPKPLAPPDKTIDPAAAPQPETAAKIAMADPVQPTLQPADAPPALAKNPEPPAPKEPDEVLLKPLPDVLPSPEAEPETFVQLEPDPVLVPITEPPAPAPANDATLAPTPGLTGEVDGVKTGRLPRIGAATVPPDSGDPAAKPPVGDATVAPDPTFTIDSETDQPPLAKYARSFENPDSKPLFAIILIDTGDATLDRAALAALPFAVSFALDPLAPWAAEASKIYRAAGQEVIMVATGIPAGATAADLEVTFQAHASALPEAVAVIDTEFGAFQADRPLATQVVPILKAQGRGLVSWDRGLNAADQVARREGLAATMVFRRLDGKAETTAAIRRALDRAAFKAAQDGRVTVIGQTAPETVAALLEWAVEGRAATVALAPVSAVLTTQ